MTDERTVDVLVVGGGVAGLAAAITARELGADVMLIEKQDHLGGSALYSAGNLLQLDGPAALDHLVSMSFGRTPTTVLDAYLSGLRSLREWLAEHDAPTVDVDFSHLPNCWPNLPGSDDVVYYVAEGDNGAGPALVDSLRRTAERLGVEILLDTAMSTLIVIDGAVLGAEVVHPHRAPSRVHARFGTMLTTGGFENNPSLTESYLPVAPVFAVGSRGNTGDGLRAAQAAGAALWHMSNFYGFWSHRATGHDTAFPLLFLAPGHLIVDSEGRRFHAETGREAHDVLRSVGDFLPGRPNRPSMPAFLISDRDLLAAGPLSRFGSPNDYCWTADNAAEVDSGWIRSASGTAALAAQIGVDADTLTTTIETYNEFARQGVDTDFGRPAESMAPIDPTTLFAIEICPGVATTSGGPRRDHSARVLAEDGQPIPGLFAAGGNGGVWGHLTEHGGGLTDALVFGKIAAESALSQQLVEQQPLDASTAAHPR